ncbi:MAG: UbiH/UbiF/VisC/COQ6 family ubiquinone biosynthesis hydroxylase [Pseudomonadota bacterium]
MNSNYDIIIVGGGMVGAALGCALGGSEFKVAVLEQQVPAAAPPSGEFDQRVSAIALSSRALFENVGAWAGIASRRFAPVRAMEVQEANGAGAIRFDAAEIGEPELSYIIENRVIQAALFERLQQFTNVHVLCPVEIAGIDLTAGHGAVRLADGRVLVSSLIVGADGAHSKVREAAGLATFTHDLAQQAIVATVRTAMPHADTARQVFLPTGPLALLPLPEADCSSIVWSADNDRADILKALDDDAFRGELAAAFGETANAPTQTTGRASEASRASVSARGPRTRVPGVPPITPPIGDRLGEIREVGPRAVFPLAIRSARRYVAERVALIGDAAHTVHPLAGQGVNLGFLDAGTLAEVLLEARRRGRDVGSFEVLRRYERARKAGNLAMQTATGAFRYLFSGRIPAMARLAGAGLSAVDRLPPLKHAFMRYAAGLTGERPPLAKRRVGPA